MKVEDDGATVFLDGEMVSIEQAEISEVLDFDAIGIGAWDGLTIPRWEETIFDLGEIQRSGEVDNFGLNFDWNVDAAAKINVFAETAGIGSLNELRYPINLDLFVPDNASNGQNFSITTSNFSVQDGQISGSGPRLNSSGVELEYSIGSSGLRNISISHPLGTSNIPDLGYFGAPINQTANLFQIQPGNLSFNFPIARGVGSVNAQLPDNISVTTSDLDPSFSSLIPPTSDPRLPPISGTGTDNFLNLNLDIDRIISFFFPPARFFSIPPFNIDGQATNETEELPLTQTESVTQPRLKLDAQLDLIDITASGGVVARQDLIFSPTDVRVTMEVDGDPSQTQTGSLGDDFSFIAPNEGTGVMTVNATYELSGEMFNEIGLALEGSLAADFVKYQIGAEVAYLKFGPLSGGPLFQLQDSRTGSALPVIGSTPGSVIPISPIDMSFVGQEDVNKDFRIERTYYIPYGLPISISDSSVTEGETLQFTVTLAEASEEPVSVNYSSEKGGGTVSFAPGETTQIIEIPTPDDTVEEPTETFEISLNNPSGISFPENLPDGESTISATGTIFDNDEPPEPEPPKTDSNNDPRLVTFDGLFYDFQAVGEFTLVQSNSGDLNIQVRQQPISETNNSVSINTAVATTLNGQRVGLYVGQDPPLLIDGIPTEIADNDSAILGEGRIFRDGSTYTIQYPGGQQLIAKFRGQRIDIQAFLGPGLEGQVSGIVGNNNGDRSDDIALPDGTVLQQPVSDQQLYSDFANSWRVTPETSLFDYQPGEDTTTFTNLNFPVGSISLDDLDPVARQEAEQLADEFGLTDPTLRTAAIIDYVLTGDIEIFAAALESQVPEAALIIDIEPEAVSDSAITATNTPTTINVLANDISTEGLPVSLETFDRTSAAGGTITRDDGGTPDDATDDLLTYAPPPNFSGSDSFQYTINDGDRTATGLVTIIVPGLNLANLDGSDGFVLDGINPGNFSGTAVSKIGDFNGDNIDDLSIGAFAADPNGNTAAGESYVVFGTNNGFPANLDLANLDGNNGLTLQGIDIQGLLGGAIGGAGDINNDGTDDLIIGAFGAPANGNNNAGKAYVVFGNSGLPANIDLANLNGSSGFVLSGFNEFDYAGVDVGGAGDINNDGIDDLYISAPGPLSSPPSKTYVVFGSETGFPANIDLSQLNGSNGFVVNDSRGLAGSAVSKAGDINNDGIADLIIGADEGSSDSYVVYGSSSFPATVELSSILNGTNGSLLSATDVLNPDGTTVRGVGDVNNDGIDDLMVAVSGTTVVDNLPITKGYVVFGDRSLPSRFDLSALNGSNGFAINDFSIDNILGFSIGEVGDFNQDGIDDILIGTSQADANGNIDSGKSYVVFGKRDGNFPTNIDLSRLDSRDGLVLNGVETEDLTGSAVDGAGDLNNDGVSDLIVGAPGSLFSDAPGKSYVVFGSNNFGSSTSLVFDEVYYLSQNPDVANLVASGQFQSGLQHFAIFGVGEERDFRVLSFNDSYYLTQNPGVASLVASGELPSGLDHFIRFGQFEGRSPGASEQSSIPLRFDENYYLNQNPDVRDAVEAGLFSSGFEHYIQVGQFQGRLTSA